MTAPRPWTPPLLLRIRFTTSLPDLDLDIPSPSQTTVAALKHLIRSRLSQPDSQRRLRFIHQGKILPDASALSSVLRPLPPPPSSTSTPTTPSFPAGTAAAAAAAAAADDPKGKGKAKAHDAAPPRVYVNCSIGDSLTDAELAAEAEAALRAPSAQPTSSASPNQPPGGDGRHGAGQNGQQQRPTPRGFDRLLNAGFSAAEVNQLRLQFREIRAAQYTPDTMPSPDTMRSLEDAWIDTNAGGALPGAAGPGGAEGGQGGGGADDVFGAMGGALDMLFEGLAMGFFWPLGCVGWVSREEEMLSGRLRDYIQLGVILSVIIGVIRMFSGH